MNKKTFRLIIILMSLAMLLLVAFQGYWINNAININEERFKKDVYESLNNVVDRLEKQEVLFIASNQLQAINKNDGRQLIELDTIKFFNRNPNKSIINKEFSDSIEQFLASPSLELNIDNETFKIAYDFEKLYQKNDFNPFMDSSIEVEIKKMRTQLDSIERFDHNLDQNIKKIAQKSEMVTIVLNELLSSERSIANRIDQQQVDSLLESEFATRGIEIPFNYAIYNQTQDQWVVKDGAQDESVYKDADLKASLFPNDLVGQINYLMVHFPGKQSFLIRKIWFTLLSSAVLILIIVISFAYALNVILKQKKISEIKNDFINNMTHEFKTPISTVSLACEALQDRDLLQNQTIVDRYIRIIQDENVRLGQQVEKVLQMATLERKEFKLKIEPVDIHQIIENAVQNIAIQVEKKGGEIKRKLNASNNVLKGDRLHLTNIIYNLLDNANKYSRDAPDILIRTESFGQNIKISIKDHGIGMSREAMHKVFDKFYRVPTGNLHDVKGFGLGLTYVKTMVEALGGVVKVSSTLHKGSEFSVYFPISQNEEVPNITG